MMTFSLILVCRPKPMPLWKHGFAPCLPRQTPGMFFLSGSQSSCLANDQSDRRSFIGYAQCLPTCPANRFPHEINHLLPMITFKCLLFIEAYRAPVWRRALVPQSSFISILHFVASYAVIFRFAALKPTNGLAAMEPGTDTWLWERNTLRLFRLKFPDIKSDFSKQFNQMIDLYDHLTEFRWPKEWAGDVSSFNVSFPKFYSHDP